MNLAKRTNWGHNFYVSYWRRDRHFMELSEPREGLAVWRTKEVPSFLRPYDPEYWSGPGNRTHDLSRRSQAFYRLSYRGFICQSLLGGHIKQSYLPVNVLQTKDFSVLDNFCVSSPYPPKHSTKMYTLLAPQWKREVTQAPVDTKKQKNTLKVSHLRSKLQGYCCLKSTLC